MAHTDVNDLPNYDTTTEFPTKCGNTSLFGLVSIKEANYSAEPGNFQEVVDLGVGFNTEPVIQLTCKNIHDDQGNVYSSGVHEFRYRWLDADHYRKFEIMVVSTSLNYPPSVAYTVTGQLGWLQRMKLCLTSFF